jgi:site-specific DNA-methyltransferase (adenine-specific)
MQKYGQIAIEALTPYERNARTHSEAQVEKIANSIREFGFLNPVLIDSKNMIIAGHGRVLAAKKLGYKEVPCLRVEDLTETQIRAYILADNKLAEEAGWDEEILRTELQGLKDEGFDITLAGFTIDDITCEDVDFSGEEEDINFAEEQLPPEPVSKKGDRYQLGDHILMVGDSTEGGAVKMLMGGIQADLCITDPPYNVDITGGTKEELKIQNDNMDQAKFIDLLQKAFKNVSSFLKPGAAFYIWLPSWYIGDFIYALEQSDLHMRELLIWVKNVFTLGRQDYQWRHEPCIYGWKEGAAHYFIDDRTKSTVFEKNIDIDAMTEEEVKDLLRRFYNENKTITTVIHEAKPARSDLHPTMKPVALIERQIENSSKEGDIVLDLFGGSGTTLIACENKHRKCRMMEYDERYADVIIKRWEEHTGRKAVKLDGND